MSELDPITLGVVQSGLQQVCNEMDLAFVRAAFSPVISEGLDRSDGIYAREDGKLIAQGELGLPVFVGTMQFSTEHLIATRPTVREGDIFAVNDPYLGGTHLMDVRFALPFFYKGAHFAWLSNTGHWPDTGGMVPGGFSARATEVVQEGLRFPPVKLYKEGKIDEEILSIILSNIRVPEQRIGDIEAQSAALLVGARRMTALLDKYGQSLVEDVIREMRQRAARQMRAKIETIPDGSYRGLAEVDSDGVVNEPLTVDMRIRVEDTELYFDMSHSSPPCLGPMNSVAATTKSSIYLAIRHVFPDVPINAGMFEPLHITEPKGTFLHAEYPRPVSGCAAEVSQRIAEAVFDALAQAIPDRLFAAPAGTSGNFAVGGGDPARGARLRDVPLHRRRLRRLARRRRAHQRMLDHRHLQDATHRGDGAEIPGALPGVFHARGLGRGRPLAGRLWRHLCLHAPEGRGLGFHGDGPWPHRAQRRARRRTRRRQHCGRDSRRRLGLPPAASLQRPGDSAPPRRYRARLDTRRWRLRRCVRARAGAGPARCDARLLHGRRGGAALRRGSPRRPA